MVRESNSCPGHCTDPQRAVPALLVPRTHRGFLKAPESLWKAITYSPSFLQQKNHLTISFFFKSQGRDGTNIELDKYKNKHNF